MDLEALMNPFVFLSLLMGILVFYSQWFDTPVSLLKPLPGPGAWSLLGNLPQLLAARFDFDELHGRLAGYFHLLFSYRVFGHRVVVIQDANLGQDALEHPGLVGRMAGIITLGNTWKEHRAVLNTFLKESSTGDKIQDVCIAEASTLVKVFREQNGKQFKAHRHMMISVTSLLCQAIFGKVCDDPTLNELVHALMLRQRDERSGVGHYLRLSIFKKLSIIARRRRNKLDTKILDIVRKLLEDYEQNSDSASSFMDIYQREMTERWREMEDNMVCSLNETNLLRTCCDLLTVGSDEISRLLLQALLFLAAHPDVQTRLHKDIETEIGREESPRLADQPQLPYLEAVLLETHRLGPTMPRTLTRVAQADMQLGDFDIPEGSVVMVNGPYIKRGAHAWNEPMQFRPERFLSSDGSIIHRPEIMLFDAGKKAYPAEIMMSPICFIIVSQICQRFTLCFSKETSLPTNPNGFEGQFWSLDASLQAIPRS